MAFVSRGAYSTYVGCHWKEGHMSSELTLGGFAEGFVAKLVAHGQTAIHPKAPEDRIGLKEVVQILEKEINALAASSGTDRAWYRALVTLRNELSPSMSGAYDGFESALRNLQLSFTSSPNPFYEEIAFNITKPFAEAVVSEFTPRQRELIARAAEAFIAARKQARG